MIIKQRLASKEEYFQLFLVCAFPIHVWAILVLMKRAEAIFLPLNISQIFSVAAYALVYALFESLLIFGVLFLVSLVLPETLFRSRLVPTGTAVLLFASIAGVLIHFYEPWEVDFMEFNLWAGIWVTITLVLAILLLAWARREERVEAGLRVFGEKLALLSMFYLVFDFVGICVLFIRNLG